MACVRRPGHLHAFMVADRWASPDDGVRRPVRRVMSTSDCRTNQRLHRRSRPMRQGDHRSVARTWQRSWLRAEERALQSRHPRQRRHAPAVARDCKPRRGNGDERPVRCRTLVPLIDIIEDVEWGQGSIGGTRRGGGRDSQFVRYREGVPQGAARRGACGQATAAGVPAGLGLAAYAHLQPARVDLDRLPSRNLDAVAHRWQCAFQGASGRGGDWRPRSRAADPRRPAENHLPLPVASS